MTTSPLLHLEHISKSYSHAEEEERLVLNDINIKLNTGEVVAILGQSGSGKSTLLRIIAGLTHADKGQVYFQGNPISGPQKSISVVFQHIALFPWLTVLENVRLGLEALRLPRAEQEKKALEAIDLIGLDGFERAYPKELSGGMQQRVGIARAMVLNPQLLLMDEPFSQLDVLTAESLRNDLIELWEQQKEESNKSILLVTNDIEEAVELADKILIFGSTPGYVRAELNVPGPRPRNFNDETIKNLILNIYQQLSSPRHSTSTRVHLRSHQLINASEIAFRLPSVETTQMSGLLESIFETHESSLNLKTLAEETHLDLDVLFPLIQAIEILGLGSLIENYLTLTSAGEQFVQAAITDRKPIFAKQLKSQIPLVRHICEQLTLNEKPIHENDFLTLLKEKLSNDEAKRVLKVAIDWGRYAEVLEYDYHTKLFHEPEDDLI